MNEEPDSESINHSMPEPHMQNQDQGPKTQPEFEQPPVKSKKMKVAKILAGGMLVVSGLVGAWFVGVIINFGCWKSECSSFEASAPILLPFLSLFITVPIYSRINKK